MKKSLVCCPDCGGGADLIGQIPATNVFAGRSLSQPLSGGELFRCRQCTMGFRWPRLSKNELDVLYRQGNNTTWTTSPYSRNDWRIAREWLAETISKTSSILDVGCFDGGFLEPLVGKLICYGVEIHSAARERAKNRGIKIIGNDFSAISGYFDFVTAFDVIEHVEHPRTFLQDCLSMVKPGGFVLVSTGNLDAPTFRWMGSRYWYCTIAEHISFVCPAWFEQISDSLSFNVLKVSTFPHGNSSLPRYLREIVINLCYFLMPAMFRNLRRWSAGGKDPRVYPELADHPPGWMTANDHFIVLLEKQ